MIKATCLEGLRGTSVAVGLCPVTNDVLLDIIQLPFEPEDIGRSRLAACSWLPVARVKELIEALAALVVAREMVVNTAGGVLANGSS